MSVLCVWNTKISFSHSVFLELHVATTVFNVIDSDRMLDHRTGLGNVAGLIVAQIEVSASNVLESLFYHLWILFAVIVFTIFFLDLLHLSHV